MMGPQDKHVQQIAVLRVLTKETGLTRTQLRDRLHDFAEQTRTADLAKDVQNIPGFRREQPLPQSSVQSFPGQTKLAMTSREQGQTFPQTVNVTNAVNVNGDFMVQQTLCAMAPVVP